jgi:hypothetical protein
MKGRVYAFRYWLCQRTHRLGISRHFCVYQGACMARTPVQQARWDGMLAERQRWMDRHTHKWETDERGITFCHECNTRLVKRRPV